jgi:cytochrome oxidase assembly protein ShyY1
MNRYRFLMSPRWIALTVFVLVLIPLFVLASSWQFDRLEQKQVRNSVVAQAQAMPSVPLTDLVDDSISSDLRWRNVTVEGEFLQQQDVLIRRKFFDNSPGYWLVSPLQLDDGRILPVIRGWIPTGRNALTPPEFLPPPSGRTLITGRLTVSEARTRPRPTDLPAEQWDVFSPREFPWTTAGSDQRIVDGAVEVITVPRDDRAGQGQLVAPKPLPAPDLGEGPHLSYAWQWRIFVLLALVGWVVLVRSQAARTDADQMDVSDDGTGRRQITGVS